MRRGDSSPQPSRAPQAPPLAADFERCLQLVGTDLREDELVATLIALGAYYMSAPTCAGLAQVLESLRARRRRPAVVPPVLSPHSGWWQWLRGEFATARSHLEEATGPSPRQQTRMRSTRCGSSPPTRSRGAHPPGLDPSRAGRPRPAPRPSWATRPPGRAARLSPGPLQPCLRPLHGDTGSASKPASSIVPQSLAADLTEQAERHGFDYWRVRGRPAVRHRRPHSCRHPRSQPGRFVGHITTMTASDTLRRSGVNLYRPFNDAVIGRLLIAAGQPSQARDRLDTALQPPRTPGCLLRRRTVAAARPHPHRPRRPPRRHRRRPRSRPTPGRDPFELRSALDDFELHGQPARAALTDVVSRFPTDSGWPELARAQAALDQTAPKTG